MWLYSALLFFSILVPFILSFDKKLQFYKRWKFVFPSIFIIASLYIIFDIIFTKLGVWGFNPKYHSDVLLFKLPIEEWLFFIVIPYASIFLHESLVLYFPNFKLKNGFSNTLSAAIIVFLLIVIILNLDKAYTVYIFSSVIIAMAFSFFDKSKVINSYYLTFLVILIPFVIVNAILTGSFIHQEVVWYNNNENLGIRFLTIPIEDFGYAYSLILFNLLLIAKLKNRGSNYLKSK
ncbi:MAG: lycopene cyclase domain-containing protein [Tenuifilaceae bacterium]